MMLATTTTTITSDNNNTTTTNTNDADATTAQPQKEQEQPQKEQKEEEAQPPKKMRKERKPKWMRAPTPFEKQRGARLILEAAGLLRPRRVVVVDGSSSGSGAVAVAEAAVAAVAVAEEEDEEVEEGTGAGEEWEESAAWRAIMALHKRLRAPSVVAATRRLFPAFVALAMRQDPDTMVTTTDGFKYDMTALPDAFVLAQHPHRFMHEALGRLGESAEEQEAQIALMDTGAALAETFEVIGFGL
jgi:hypothetical protein